VWASVLALLILAITLGPRLRVGAVADRNVDLRVQDLLLPLVIVLLALSFTRPVRMRPVWGHWAALYAGLAVVTTIVFLETNPDMPAVRAILFAGRALEVLILAMVVATLYRAAGTRAMPAVLRAVHLAALLNLGWVGYQYATGTRKVLLGTSVGEQIESYGPKLIGEASSFGTGFFFAFITAVGAAEFMTRCRTRAWATFLMFAGLAGATLSQSRISMAGAALTMCLIFATPRMRRINPIGVTYLALLTALALILVPPMMQSQGRLSTEGVEASAEYRVEYIWRPLLQYALGHPFLGIGPGSLGTSRYPWTEAHNIILRVALDFGLFTAACFAFLLGTLLVRSWRAGRGAQSVEQRVFATVAFYSVAVVVVAGMLQESLSAVMSSHLTMLTVGLFAGATACAHPD
jgi:hypothetical protein